MILKGYEQRCHQSLKRYTKGKEMGDYAAFMKIAEHERQMTSPWAYTDSQGRTFFDERMLRYLGRWLSWQEIESLARSLSPERAFILGTILCHQSLNAS